MQCGDEDGVVGFLDAVLLVVFLVFLNTGYSFTAFLPVVVLVIAFSIIAFLTELLPDFPVIVLAISRKDQEVTLGHVEHGLALHHDDDAAFAA